MGCKPIEKAKPKHRKGLWSPEEDNKLRNCILKHGHGCWSSVPIKAGLQRNGKSCRLRWINYLRPGLKRGMFSKQEEDTILNLHHMLGNKWSQIAQHLPGRTDNEIKNYWHSYLKKKLAKAKEIESHDQQQIQHATSSSDTLDFPLSPQKHSIQESSYGIFENMERSLAHYYDPTYEHNNYNYNKEACQGSLPKVLFAEWLSLDHVNGFDQNSTFQEGVAHISEGPFCGEEYDHNCLSHSSSNEVYNSQINFSNQVVGNEFIHCIPGGADLLCDNNFSLNSDAMYV